MEDEKDASKIKIFASEDEKLKNLGELLSNKSSRDIIRLLIEKEMYTNEIANKLDLRANLVSHHLKKLEELGLVEITTKPIVKKGNHHRHFKMMSGLFVMPNQSKEELKKSGIMKKIFKESVQLVGLGFLGFIGWIYSIPEQQIIFDKDQVFSDLSDDSTIILNIEPSNELILSVFIPISIIISGILVKTYIIKLWKKRKESVEI